MWDFEDEEFYGFHTDFEHKKEETQEELRREFEDKERLMETYREETEEYKGSRMSWGERKKELDKKIELNEWYGELGRNLEAFEEMNREVI